MPPQVPYLTMDIPGQTIPQVPGAINLGPEDISLDDIISLAVKGGIGAQTTARNFGHTLGTGNAFQIGLFVDADDVHVPAHFDLVETSGFSQVGLGAALYEETNSLPSFNGGFQSADGRFWRIVNSTYGLLITQFGAIPDSNISFAVGADLNNPASFVPVTGTDNAPAINNALNYVASLPSGGTVGVPPGAFGCNAGLFVKARTRFQGLGGWLVKLDGGPVYHFIQINDADNVELIGLNVDGNRHGNDSTNTGHNIRTHNSQNVNVSFCQTYNSCGYGVSSDVDIANITYAFNGIFNAGADGIDMHNTSVENNSSQIIGNIIDGFGNKGVPKAGIHGRGQGLTVVGNVVKDCGSIIGGITGIGCGNGETIYGQRVIGNYVEMGTRCTLAKGIGTNNPGGVVIGNHVAGDIGTFTGYSFNGVDQIIQGNMLSPAPGATISCVRDGYAYGVTVSRALSSGNTAIACGQDGFSDLGTDNRFSANSAVDCPGYAYNMVGSTGALLDSLNVQSNCTLGLLNRGAGTLFDQKTDVSSTPTFAFLRLTNAPVGGTDATTKAYVDALLAGPGSFTIDQTGLATAALTGTLVETVMVSKTIPAGLMGPNGRLSITGVCTNNNNANSKFVRVRLGGLVGTVFMALTQTTNISFRFIVDIYAQNSQNLQKGWVGNNPVYAASGSPPLLGAVDMTVNQDLVITGQLTNIGDSIIIEERSIQFILGPP